MNKAVGNNDSYRPNTIFSILINKFCIMLLIVYLVFGVFVFSFLGYKIYNELELKINGEIVSGIINGKRYHSGESSNDGSSYYLLYKFQTQQSKEIQGRCQISSKTYNQLNLNETVPIVYNPNKPENNCIVGESFLYIFIPAILLCALLQYSFFKVLKEARKIKRLYNKGICADGEITDIKAMGSSDNNRGSISARVYYSFTDQFGNVHNNYSESYYCRELFHKIKQDEKINVLYDENDPEKNTWADEWQYW